MFADCRIICRVEYEGIIGVLVIFIDSSCSFNKCLIPHLQEEREIKKEEEAKAKAEKKGHKDNASKIPGPRKAGV